MIGPWAGSDPAGASQWLQGLPAGHGRDAAVGVFSSVIDGPHPEVAFRWTATIEETSLRNERMESVARHWLAANIVEASAGIAQSVLPQKTKDALLGSSHFDSGGRANHPR